MHIQKCERAIIHLWRHNNEPIQSAPSVDDTKIPFGEEKQLEAPEPVQVAVSEDDENGGF